MTRTAKVDLLIQIVLLVVGAIAGILLIKHFWGPEAFFSENALKYELAEDIANGADDFFTMLCVKLEIFIVKVFGDIPYGYWLGAGCGTGIAMMINTILGTDIISYYVRNIGIGVLATSVALLITILPLGIFLLLIGIAIFFIYPLTLGLSGMWIIPIIANLIRLILEGKGKKAVSSAVSPDGVDVISDNENS